MPAMTTFSAPFSAGPSKLTFVGVPRAPIQTPSGCAYLSLLSERIVSHATPGVTSLPAGPCGALSLRRNGPAPLNSLPGRKPGFDHTPWFGVPPRTACETTAAPPLAMKLRIAIAAARDADQRDLGGAGRGEHLLHLGGEIGS